MLRVIVVAAALLSLGACKQSGSDTGEADKRLDRALARKHYGGLLLYLKDHPKSPRAAKARKAADAIATEGIQGYVDGATKDGTPAETVQAIKEILEELHRGGGQTIYIAFQHRYPESIKHDTSGALANQSKHSKQLAFDRQKEITTNMGRVLGERTRSVFRLASWSSFPAGNVKNPMLTVETELGEGDTPLTTEKGSFSRLKIKLTLKILRPGKEPLTVAADEASIPEGWNMRYRTTIRPGQPEKPPHDLVYTRMREQLWGTIRNKVCAGFGLRC